MSNETYLISHIEDLILRSTNLNIITSTSFLTMSEQSLFLNEIVRLNKEFSNEVDLILDGGNSLESDRKILFIKPKSYSIKELNEYIKEDISLLLVTPKNEKYSDKFTHRDFLGALMNIGIKRETIGDIIIDSSSLNKGIIYLLSSIKTEVINNLTSIKHTSINIKEIFLNEAPFKMNFEIISIYVSSLRVDNIIKEVFNLSREDAKELIIKECVFVNGITKTSPSYLLKKDDRVSIKGKGKFIFLDESTINKKARYHTKIKKYS